MCRRLCSCIIGHHDFLSSNQAINLINLKTKYTIRSVFYPSEHGLRSTDTQQLLSKWCTFISLLYGCNYHHWKQFGNHFMPGSLTEAWKFILLQHLTTVFYDQIVHHRIRLTVYNLGTYDVICSFKYLLSSSRISANSRLQ